MKKINKETHDIIKSKTFFSKDEKGNKYEIEMELNYDSIKFKLEINKGFIIKKYSNIFSFDKLKENIIFSSKKNIEEIYEQLILYINDESSLFKTNDDNIIIKFMTNKNNSFQINFELNQERFNTNHIINILIEEISNSDSKINKLESKFVDLELKNQNSESTINNLKSENKNLEQKILKLESENKNLETKVNYLYSKYKYMKSNFSNLETKTSSLESKNNNFESKINNIELKNKNLDLKNNDILLEKQKMIEAIGKLKKLVIENSLYIKELKELGKIRRKDLIFGDSLIVKESEIKMICDWIYPDAEIKANLLYRTSRDGKLKFHKYCDNKGPTIIFIKINNGYRFGGFSGISWEGESNSWIKDCVRYLYLNSFFDGSIIRISHVFRV